MSSDEHSKRILDQFTRQAVPFATSPAIRNTEALQRIVRIARAGPADVALDVACGPGLLVCALAKVVWHATGIDLTAAMLDQARLIQQEQALENVSWQLGEAVPLPFAAETFDIVTSRFAFHHLQDPLAALREMVRVAKVGGRIVVADSAPVAGKAAAFNAAEVLRDPSHVRALPIQEHQRLFSTAGLAEPELEDYRLEVDLDGLLARSFPKEGDLDVLRQIYASSIAGDDLDMNTRLVEGKILCSFPVAVLSAVKGRSGRLQD